MNGLHAAVGVAGFIAKRDRVRLAVWVGSIVVLILVSAVSTKGIYPDPMSLRQAAELARTNRAALALNGPDLALETIGGQIVFQIGAFGLLTVGLMAVLLTGRVTRAEEDSGRLELVRAMPVGRHAPLAAGLGVVTAALFVLGALSTVALLSQGLPVAGSLVFGVSYFAFGLAFVGVTALTAQISENPRVVTGSAGAMLGISFALRAAGDVGDGTLSWASPMGWAQRSAPYAGDRWWPLVLLVTLGVLLIAAARAVGDRRDFGGGLIAPRTGPPHAARSLRSSLALAARLHRAAIAWWVVSTFALGLVYGSLGSVINDIPENDVLEEIIASFGEGGLVEAYLSTSLLVTALLAAGPGLQVALRLRVEESGGRAEPMLATPTSRVAWMGSHLVLAFGASALGVTLGGFGLGLGFDASSRRWHESGAMAAASLAHVPAVWVLIGAAAALFGVKPRWSASAWGLLAFCFVVAMFGPLLDLPEWAVNLSPFQHTPAVPSDEVDAAPLVVLLAAGGLLTGAGLASFRRRDMVPSG